MTRIADICNHIEYAHLSDVDSFELNPISVGFPEPTPLATRPSRRIDQRFPKNADKIYDC